MRCCVVICLHFPSSAISLIFEQWTDSSTKCIDKKNEKNMATARHFARMIFPRDCRTSFDVTVQYYTPYPFWVVWRINLLIFRDGQAFFKKKSANPHRLLTPLSQIRKFLQNTANSVSKSPKSWLFIYFFIYKFELEHYTLYLQGEKVFICGLAEFLGPQITKEIRSANRISEMCHICGRSANLTNYKSANLGFADLICGPPSAHLC